MPSCPEGDSSTLALLMSERDDLIPELGIRSQHPLIAVTVNTWWVNEQGESLEELEGGE